jgi:WhiB family transcriptional regulator, redox-sensing transcriptional regulator
MAPMHRPGTTVVLEDPAGVATVSEHMAAIARAAVPAQVAGTCVPAPQPASAMPVTMAGVPRSQKLPCADDPDLFFAESPTDVECAKALCRGCPARIMCLAGALERREPWGVWGGELFLRGEILPRKRPRGRPRKDEVAA